MKLPRGVRIDHGYVQARLWHEGRYVLCENFGIPSRESLDAAAKAYLDAKKRIREGRWGVKPEIKRICFKEARAVFYKRHYAEWRHPSTNAPRSAGSLSVTHYNLETLGTFFDKFWLDEIGIKAIKAYKEDCLDDRGLAAATFNKHRMLLSSLFTQFNAWGLEDSQHAVKLPVDAAGGFVNPCDHVPTMAENERKRVPGADELAKAHTWCSAYAPKLWYAIEKALETALRKSDLLGVDGKVQGIQKKTGQAFSLPLVLEKPVEYSRAEWNRLRAHMGWLPGDALHTTWHDLRHWAPTLLAAEGYTPKQIQSFTNHKDEKALARYINLKDTMVPDMLKIAQDRIAAIKSVGVKLGVLGDKENVA